MLTPRRDAAVACPDTAFRVGNYDITYTAGCLRKARRQDGIPDGWYNRVRVADGQIVEVENDETRLAILPDLCQATGDAVRYEAAPGTCNVVRVVGNQINARIITADVQPDDALWLEGCGSEYQPFKIAINPAKLKELLGLGAGTTSSQCGVRITNGVIEQFPPTVVTGVMNMAPGVLEAWIDGCTLVLAVPGVAPGGGQATPSYEIDKPCQPGVSGMRIGVFAGAQGQYFIRVINTYGTAEHPAPQVLVPQPAAIYETLSAAQAFLANAFPDCPTTGGA